MWITQNNKVWYSESEYKELEERIEQQHTNIMRNNLQYNDIDITNKKYKSALKEIREYINSQLDCFGNAVYGIEQYHIKKITDKINEVLK